MKKLLIAAGILLSFSASAAVEYGLFERSSDGRFQSVCPIRDDGAVICTYSYGLQKVSVVIDQVNVGAHQQNLRGLEALTAISFFGYEDAIRKMLPGSNFLLNGFYVKYDARTILLDFAHFHTPAQINVPANVKSVVSSILRLLTDVYYTHTVRPNPLVRKQNTCPVLIGRYDCQRNSLVVTQLNYGVDDLYVFQYSDRLAPFDFAANDAGMKNAVDRYVATCTTDGVTLDGSTMRLNARKDLEFSNGNSVVTCRRMASSFWR